MGTLADYLAALQWILYSNSFNCYIFSSLLPLFLKNYLNFMSYLLLFNLAISQDFCDKVYPHFCTFDYRFLWELLRFLVDNGYKASSRNNNVVGSWVFLSIYTRVTLCYTWHRVTDLSTRMIGHITASYTSCFSILRKTSRWFWWPMINYSIKQSTCNMLQIWYM